MPPSPWHNDTDAPGRRLEDCVLQHHRIFSFGNNLATEYQAVTCFYTFQFLLTKTSWMKKCSHFQLEGGMEDHTMDLPIPTTTSTVHQTPPEKFGGFSALLRDRFCN